MQVFLFTSSTELQHAQEHSLAINLRLHLATNASLSLLASTCVSVWPGLKTIPGQSIQLKTHLCLHNMMRKLIDHILDSLYLVNPLNLTFHYVLLLHGDDGDKMASSCSEFRRIPARFSFNSFWSAITLQKPFRENSILSQIITMRRRWSLLTDW